MPPSTVVAATLKINVPSDERDFMLRPLLVLLPVVSRLVAVTCAATDPSVAVGTVPPISEKASAASESAAKPTEGGLNRKTEYTFFY